MTVNIEVGKEFLVTIKRLGINGEGVGYYKRKVVFVPGVLPNEEVVVRVMKVFPKHSEAEVVRIKKRSPYRVKPECSVYTRCGGCQLQHLSYEGQLIEKQGLVERALERYSGFGLGALDVRACIGMQSDPNHYRNKSQFQLSVNARGEVLSGLYHADSHQLIDIVRCGVQDERINRVTRVVKEILQTLEIPIYDEKKNSGIVRTVVSRVSKASGEVQVTLVTVSKKLPKKKLILDEINKQLPEVVSIFQNINSDKSSLIFGKETVLLDGKQTIIEKIGDLQFALSARTFFQLNPVQTVHLYDEVKRAAGLTGREKVVDAYCGAGAIGLWLASDAAEVRGMDVIVEGIADARENAQLNDCQNVRYEVGHAEDLLPQWDKLGWRADVIVVDPPRTGLDRGLVDTLLKVQPARIVYVSCNPSTLAKDLQILKRKFDVEYVQPVDMFPMTAHVETVMLLRRR